MKKSKKIIRAEQRRELSLGPISAACTAGSGVRGETERKEKSQVDDRTTQAWLEERSTVESWRWQACDLNSQFNPRNLHRTMFSRLWLEPKWEKFGKVEKTRASLPSCFWEHRLSRRTKRFCPNDVPQIRQCVGALYMRLALRDARNLPLLLAHSGWKPLLFLFLCLRCKMYSAAALLRSAALWAREKRKPSHITHLQPELSLWGSATGGWALWNQNSS